MEFDVSCLEAWLKEMISDLSIDDPMPLTEYIIALVKREEPEDKLKDICTDQLQVFLQNGTANFVEKMFAFLRSQKAVKPYEKNDSSESTKSKINLIDSCKLQWPNGSRSPSLDSDKCTNGNRSRQRSPIRRSRSPFEFKGKQPTCVDAKWHTDALRYQAEHGEYNPAECSSRANRQRLTTNEKVNVDVKSQKLRNSPDDSPERSRERFSIRFERSERIRGSREGERSRQLQKKAVSPRLRREHDDGHIHHVQQLHTQEKRRWRCRDFDEKGFCVLGDSCKYEHGSNPVVVPRSSAASALFSIPNVGLIDPALVSGACLIPRVSPDGGRAGLVSTISLDPAASSADELSEPVISEAGDASGLPVYNPTPIVDSLSSTVIRNTTSGALSDAPRSIRSTVSSGYHAGTYSQSSMRIRHGGGGIMRGYGPSCEIPVNRNIISVPLTSMVSSREHSHYQSISEMRDSGVNIAASPPPAYEPARPELSAGAPEFTLPLTTKPSSGLTSFPGSKIEDSGDGEDELLPAEYKPSPISSDSPYDLRPTSVRVPARGTAVLVYKLPWQLNNMTSLHNHFTRFGTVINVETNFQGNNRQALIEFNLPAEAEAAYRSPEPILENRFIRLSRWPNDCFTGNTSFMRRGNFNNHGQIFGNRRGGSFVGLPFNKSSLLGDASVGKSRLPVKLRLGEQSRLKRPLISSLKQTHNQQQQHSSRSRWRLEREENGRASHFSDDADEAEDLLEKDQATPAVDVSGGAENDLDTDDAFNSTETITGNNIGSFSATWPSNRDDFDDDTEFVSRQLKAQQNAIWKQQKAQAMRERQSKVAKLEKLRAIRRQEETRIKQLHAELSLAHAELDSLMSSSASSVDACDSQQKKQSVTARKQALFLSIQRIDKELQELGSHMIPTKVAAGVTGIGETVSVASVKKSAVNQFLPEGLASKRVQQIQEVKMELQSLDLDLQRNKDNPEIHSEIRRKITELKRRMVNLETVRSSDLAAATASGLPVRGQTKLDKRPRSLYVSGHNAEDVEDFRQALSMNYFHTESFCSFTENGKSVIHIAFRTRDIAESAMRVFSNFRGRQLVMSFNPPAATVTEPSIPPVVDAESQKNVPSCDLHCALDTDRISTSAEFSGPVVDATVGEELRSPVRSPL